MKITILGLGKSFEDFNPTDFDMSIGVNDIWRYHKSEVVVCLDPRKNFTADRMKAIDECTPQAFYSQFECYRTRKDFQGIEILNNYPTVTCDLTLQKFQKSFCSPFVAAQIAFRYYDATEIHLFGVDLVNHPHINGALCNKIKLHFKNLKAALEAQDCKMIVHGEGILKDI